MFIVKIDTQNYPTAQELAETLRSVATQLETEHDDNIEPVGSVVDAGGELASYEYET